MDDAPPGQIPLRDSQVKPPAILAFEEALQAITPRMRLMVRRYHFPVDQIDDLIQDVATSVYEQVLKRLQNEEQADIRTIEGYLMRSCGNRLVDFLRRKRPEVSGWGSNETEGDVVSFELLRDRSDHVMDNQALALDRADCVSRVLEHIRQHQPQQGLALELAFSGVSGRNMAEALGKSPSAANEFLSQTRKLFETLLREWCEEDFNSDR
ncbi:MAG: sigma-70 family RNA polymerase sigma factor [Gammaproteobacteria bacterium]|nr:sigma-70 family RNA polymerase sigma factor [Gammaproteobacteria bacterium]